MVKTNDVLNKNGYFVNGRNYDTLHDLAKDYGLSSTLIESRVLYGYSYEEAVLDADRFRELSKKRRRDRANKLFVYGEKEYTTLRKLSNAMGMPYADVLRAFETCSLVGVTIREKRLERKPGRRYERRVFFEKDDVTYYSRKDYAKANGLDLTVFRGYLRKTDDVEEATRLTIAKQVGYTFEGVPYRSLRAVSRKAGVKYAWLLKACKETDTVDEAVAYARETATLQTRRYKNR